MLFEAWCVALLLPLCILPYVPWAASVVALPATTAWGCPAHDVAKLHAFVSLGFTRSGAAPAALSLCEALSRPDRWRAFGGHLLLWEPSLSTGLE